MPRREFATQNKLQDYAERIGDAYLWEGTAAFAKQQGMLSPDQYEIVDVRTSRGVRRAMLIPKAILQAEFDVNAPVREALAIKRERLRAKRAEKQKRPTKHAAKAEDGPA
jgi:hypothetical protein